MKKPKRDKRSLTNEQLLCPFYNEEIFDCKKRTEAIKEWEKIFLVEEVWGASVLPDFNQK